MIKLEDKTIWKKMSSPYGNSEEIPDLICKLSKNNDNKIADEIIWEYIYHQGSVYENTLATFPHLLKIIEEADNKNFKLDLIISLGIILSEFDNITTCIDSIFNNSELTQETQNKLRVEFINAIKDFNNIINTLIPYVENLDESNKRFFLVSYLTTIKKYKEAEVFKTFTENDEYMFVCPNCETEIYLWNEENVLNAYDKSPIFNDNFNKLEITFDDSNRNINWLIELINKFKINSLKPLVPYFKGSLNCSKCNKKTNIFEGIINSI